MFKASIKSFIVSSMTVSQTFMTLQVFILAVSIREIQAVQFGQGLEQYEDNQEK